MKITQPKIASLDPSWTVFRGASVLAHPLGKARAADDQTPRGGRHAVRLYDGLTDLMGQVDGADWRDRFGFCPLPAASYHLTLADLVNDGNLGKLPEADRAHFGGERVAQGSEYPAGLVEIVERSGILSVPIPRVRFTVRAVEILNRSALAATLDFVDDETGVLSAFIEARDDLAVRLHHRFGVQMQPYKPHISLGYFANPEAADAAVEAVARLNLKAEALFDGRAFQFDGPDVFVFADMATFWPHRA